MAGMATYNGYTGEERAACLPWMRAQVKSGAHKPADCYECSCCGGRGRVMHFHAESYAKPYGGHLFEYPICYPCHMMVHCRFSSVPAWQRFVGMILSGVQPSPMIAEFGTVRTLLQVLSMGQRAETMDVLSPVEFYAAASRGLLIWTPDAARTVATAGVLPLGLAVDREDFTAGTPAETREFQAWRAQDRAGKELAGILQTFNNPPG